MPKYRNKCTLLLLDSVAGLWMCSACGETLQFSGYPYLQIDFCPYCGTKIAEQLIDGMTA